MEKLGNKITKFSGPTSANAAELPRDENGADGQSLGQQVQHRLACRGVHFTAS